MESDENIQKYSNIIFSSSVKRNDRIKEYKSIVFFKHQCLLVVIRRFPEAGQGFPTEP